MKGITGWSYRPYLPADRMEEANQPYICRLAPSMHAVEVEVLDNGAPQARHILKIRLKGTMEPWREVAMDGPVAVIDGLQAYSDYELYAQRSGSEAERSAWRFVRTGFYPDTMVNYVHPQDDIYAFSGRYLCDPTFVRTPSGALVAAMDVYEHNAPQQLEVLLRSEDNGKTWRYVCDLFPAYWGTLFMHGSVMYMLAISTENGHVLIGASYDEGYTWTKPSLLFVGGNTQRSCGFQRQPMPVVHIDGRLMTNIEFGSWQSPRRYGIATLFAPDDADLLDPASWTLSDFTYYNPDWPGSPKGGTIALLEGSIYEAKDGRLVNLLRMQMNDSCPNHGKACLLEIDRNNPEAAPKFLKIIDMPTGANSRTHVLYDEKSGRYWGIGNLVTDPRTPSMRNVMALTVSDDGYDWRVAKILLDYRDLDPREVGFQYTSFVFDGDDILYLSRTSFNQAHNFHDANCQTMGVVKDFRQLG